METAALSKTHKRILGTLLFVVEQKVENIEHMILHTSENASYFIEQDLSEESKEQLLSKCKAIKHQIYQMSATFEVRKRKISQAHYISTIQSQMWEHISDAFSDKLKGYGDKLRSDAKIVDPQIKILAEMIDQLKL